MEIFSSVDQKNKIYPMTRIRMGFMEGLNADFTDNANKLWFPNSKTLIYNFLRIIEPGFKICDYCTEDLFFKIINKDNEELIVYLCTPADNDLLPMIIILKNNQEKRYECGFDETHTKMVLNLKATKFKIGDFLITANSSNGEAEVKINGSNISFNITVVDSNSIDPKYNLFKAIVEALKKLDLDSSLKDGSRDILKICKAFKDSLKELSSDFELSIVSKNANQEQLGALSIDNEKMQSFEIVVDLPETGRVVYKLDTYNDILLPKAETGIQSSEALEQRKILAYQLQAELNNL